MKVLVTFLKTAELLNEIFDFIEMEGDYLDRHRTYVLRHRLSLLLAIEKILNIACKIIFSK